jgi:predicted TIM-barrel fold metal-dependent hydrolase
MLLHVDTQRDSLDAADVRLFADRVLAPLPRLVVTIAHLGGSGGYGARTRMIFRTLQEWERVQYARGDTARRLCFDISAVVLDRESEGVPATTPTEARALREDLRRVGLHNIVLGSDYPVFDPVRTLELLRSRVGLTADEVAQVAAPRAHCGA